VSACFNLQKGVKDNLKITCIELVDSEERYKYDLEKACRYSKCVFKLTERF
jgi:hypothetical protein